MELDKSFGKALRSLREAKGLNQQAFVDAVQREHVSRLERGKSTPNLALIDRLAGVLDVHPLSLLTSCYQIKENSSLEDLIERVRLDLKGHE
ncbi:helix-turn-helix transcriptional regulator [Pseudomonas sp.]|uniref:helix-turn-helix domain-containing protein n=1 Tax=Pseudomonas sp. TaxID=306 RepID=UPI0028A62010|nr:helix-turn-helix transcriptional regulator [Pseudomonas sp.]